MRKRILALLLALVMCLSLLPTAAFAEDITDTGDTAIITDSTGDEGDTPAAPTGGDEDEKDGEDADEDGNSTEGAADPAPVVGSAPTPLLAAAAPTPVALGAAIGHSKHCVCGGTTILTSHRTIGDHKAPTSAPTWTATDSLPTGLGYYYLTADVTITETWTISTSNIRLCLNGHTITMNGAGPVIKVTSGASITLTDCTSTPGKITHGDHAGCGVYVDGTGTFNMFGGIITGNQDDKKDTEPGGGVYVAPNGKFNMYGGKISGNRGTYYYYATNTRVGGGVYVAVSTKEAGTFNMYGGTIGGTGEDDGNSADKGGGVYLEHANPQETGATFKMSGGEIVGNSAENGGGVYAGGESKFTMTGGSITNNEAAGSANTYVGGGVYVSTESITVGGSATITGNKSEGVTSDGKDDNVYLCDVSIIVYVKENFSGAVGININGDLWGIIPPGQTTNVGADWIAVAGDGGSAAITDGKITYDNGDFEIKSTGKLTCLHVCEIKSSSEYLYVCERCGAQIRIKTEFKNAAGTITTRTQYYETASAAFEAAVDNCVITMLTAAEFESYTWDLDRKTVTLYADYTVKNLTVKNGTLNLGYTRSIQYDYIHNMVVGSGATVNVAVYPSGFYGDLSLTVESGGKVVFKSGHVDDLKVESGGTAELKGGTFDIIKVINAGDMTCADLLAPGYAYFDKGTNAIKAGNTTTLSNVTVGEHASCSFTADNSGVCGCGRECPHSNFDAADGKVSCSVCNTQMVAKVEKTGSTPLYYTTFNAALEGVRDAKSTDSATLTLLADTTLSANATLPGGVYTIDLNGKKLGNSTGSSYVLTADGNGAATIQDSSTDKTGRIDCALKCTVAGSNSPEIISGTFARLELDMTSRTGTGWPHLFGGTFEKIVRTDSDSDTASRTIRVISMLAPGYVLERNDATSDASDKCYRADTEITTTAITNVTVVPCTCGDSSSCDYCGKNLPVELTLYDANDAVISREYYASPEEAVGKIGTTATKATIRLLRKAVGYLNYTNSIPLTIDLNGQDLNSAIKVDTTTGLLTITGDGTVGAVSTDKVTVTKGTLYVNGGKFAGGLEVRANGNAVLSGGTFGSIKVEGDNKTVSDLLAEDYGYWCTIAETANSTKWATTEQLGYTELSREKGISAVTVTALPGISVTPETTSVAYGTPVTLTAAVSGVAEGETITYQWYTVSGTTEAEITDATGNTYITSNTLAIGMHTFICKATVYGYTLTGDQVTVTVTKATLTEQTGTTGGSGSSGGGGGSSGGGSESGSIPATYTAPKANALTFATQNTGGSNPTAKAQALVTAPTTLPNGCKVYYRLGEDGTFAETIPTATNAGMYTVQWYIDGGDNYDGVGSAESPKSLTVKIAPMKVANPSGDGYSAFSVYYKDGDSYTGTPAYTYNGSAIRPVFRLQDTNGFVIPASGYIYSITDNVNAGNATITIADNDPNDNFEIKESKITLGIARKTVTLTPDTYTVYVTKDSDVTVDLDKVAKALGMPANDGDLTFYIGNDKQNALYTLTTTTQFGVCSTNHSSTFTLKVEVSEKTVPVVSVTDFTKTYDGEAVTINDVTKNATVTATGVTGDIAGEWSWTNGNVSGFTEPTNVADSGYYSLTFTPTSAEYSPVTTTVQVTIDAKNLADSNITATADSGIYTGSVIKVNDLVVKYAPTGKTPLTLTYGTDHNIAPGTSSAINAGTHKLTIIGTGNYTGTRQVDWTIAPKPLGIDGIIDYHPTKTYDGTVTADTSSLSISGAVEGETLESSADYQITAAFADADVGTNKAVSVTVKLLNTDKTANYCFNLNGQLVKEMTVGAKGYIAPFPLDTPPTARENVVRIRQDVSVRSGSYLLPDNVDLTLPEGFSPSRELHFTLGNDLPAKVEAQIDENTGMLSYTISGGRSGEKFAIPVTVTLPNFVKQSGDAAAVALFALDEDQVQETDPNAGTITLSFTVEIELTGGGHEHIRRPPTGTGTSGGGSGGTSGSGSASGSGSTGGNGSGVASPATGDAGIALYGVLSVLSLTGGAWIGRRRKS